MGRYELHYGGDRRNNAPAMRRDYNGGLIAFSRYFSFFSSRTCSPESSINNQFRLLCITCDTLTTTHNFSQLLRQCIDERSISGIKTIQAHMLKSGFPAEISGSKLVDASLKCGDIDYARQVFDGMSERHIVTWNSLIAYLIKYRRSKEAVEMYRLMITNNVLPDEYTLSSVFKAFSDLSLEKEAQRSHGLAVILGLEVSNVFVGSALVDMYVKFGKTREAKLVLDRVEEKDVVLITALIVGYSQKGEDTEAVKAFQSMLVEKVQPNEYTYASVLISCGNLKDIGNGKLIHGLMVKSGFESALASQTSLLTMYLRCSLVDDSLRVFKCIEYPNQVSWTSLISGLVQNGREEMALIEFRKMMRDSIKPNSFTLSSALRGCSNLAMFEEGRQIHGIVTKYGFDRDKYAGSGLIDLYGKCGCSDMARLVFDTLSEVDVISLNTMIYSYAQNGFGREALDLFERMINLGLQPNDVTVLSVLLACNNSRLVEEGCELFDSFRKDKIMLTNDHYACMVDLLGRAGRLEEAEMLTTEVINPDLVLWRTLLSACKVHKKVEMAERITRKILEIEPGDEGTLILMSNLYASTGKWNRVIEMKSKMKDMKLKKNPAMSWVEINKETHTFMAGDLFSHPNSEQILENLEELIKKSKDLGYVEDKSCVFQDMEETAKERSLHQHSEKLAIAFAVWRNVGGSIRILKNLRVCVDCHSWIKIVSRVMKREIICRDSKRFHHFRDGSCSCGDYW
ncbi:Pentatricopeptide repeat [Arabidopsis suecica]|uniref:Pentatricopeptide repeat n=1 Tax=Arabidopsis suecica TaxID=45249 RepID=A0A8T2DUX5_ARASU|nr:Pentatricopeptide repeat [Arabidopsis suecica]